MIMIPSIIRTLNFFINRNAKKIESESDYEPDYDTGVRNISIKVSHGSGTQNKVIIDEPHLSIGKKKISYSNEVQKRNR